LSCDEKNKQQQTRYCNHRSKYKDLPDNKVTAAGFYQLLDFISASPIDKAITVTVMTAIASGRLSGFVLI